MKRDITIEQAKEIVQRNRDLGLYKGDPGYTRVYFTYDGGIYNNQISSFVSPEGIEKTLSEHKVKDVYAIGDEEAWAEWLPKKA